MPLEPLGRDGAQRFAGAAGPMLPALARLFESVDPRAPGTRVVGCGALRRLLSPHEPPAQIAARAIGADARAVRAILFDKTAETNWSLGWHQDRTICVRARLDVPGYGPWSVKRGLQHVAPPFDLLARMVTMRIHVDDVPDDNAPLLVAAGSHRLGRIAERDVDRVVTACQVRSCLARAGDIWLYATPILHASDAAARARRRRVLQIDFAAEALPGGLEWLGV